MTVTATRTHALQASPARRWLGFTAREHGAAVAIFAIVTFLFFFPLVRGDTYSDVAGRQQQLYPWAGVVDRSESFPVLHYDQDESFYPWQVFMSRLLRDGEFPLWNPYSFAGAPFFANGQSGVLYPPRLALTYAVSPTRAHDALLVTHLFLAGVAMFLLLGFVGVSFPAALVGGLAWMLNSFALAWQALEHYVAIEAFLPVGVLLAHAAVRRRSWPAAFGLALVLGLLFLGGNVLFVELALVAIFGYGVALAVADAGRDWVALRGSAGRLAVAAVLFAGLAAISLLPTLALSGESARGALSYGELERFALPWRLLANIFRPPQFLSFDPYHEDLFAGTAVGLLALVGLLRREAIARFAAVLGVLTILFMLHTPVTAAVDRVLPGFDNFKPLARAAFLLQLSLAVLAAFGLDTALRWLGTPTGRRLAGSPLVAGAIAGAAVAAVLLRAIVSPLGSRVDIVVVLLGALAVLAADVLDRAARRVRRLPVSLFTGALLGSGISGLIVPYGFPRLSSAGAFVIALVAAVVAGSALELAGRVSPRIPIGVSTASVLIVAAVAGSVVGQAWLWKRSVMLHQPDSPRYLYPRTPLIRYLEQRPEARFLPTGWSFRGATSMIYPLRSAGGYESLLPARIQNFWRVVGDGLSPDELASKPLVFAYYTTFELSKQRPELLARAGVDYVVALPPRADEATPPGYRLAYSGPDGRVLEVRNAVPRAFLVTGCRRAASSLDALRAFVSPSFDARRSVVLEEPYVKDGSCDPAAAGRGGTASVVGRSNNRLQVAASSPRPAWLVVTESWDRGWTATLDGHTVDVLPANSTMRAVRVPAGSHRVTFTYRSQRFRTGAVVSGATLGLVLAGLALSARRRWRRARLR